jgi:hypothetical protein
MSKTTQAGKKPLSSKPKRASFQEPDFFRNKLVVAPEVAAEIAEQGLECRWIDYKKYIADDNQHNRGWTVYRRKQDSATAALQFGNNPDGIIRRGNTVLAVRPIEQGDEHRAYIKERNKILKGFKKAKANELREAGGSDLVVDDKFDDSEQDE